MLEFLNLLLTKKLLSQGFILVEIITSKATMTVLTGMEYLRHK
jgi:hypothetical protein